MYTQKVGRFGEDEAVKYLEQIGYTIIERNFECNQGEIDIIAKDKNDVDDACAMMLQYIKSAYGYHNTGNGEILKGYSWEENVNRDKCPYTPYSRTKSNSNPLF